MKMQRLNKLQLPKLQFPISTICSSRSEATGKQYSQRKLSRSQRMAIINRHRKDHFDESNVGTDDFLTTQQLFAVKGPDLDPAPARTNFKKKTDFSHFYNATFTPGGGVFFNPPVNGL